MIAGLLALESLKREGIAPPRSVKLYALRGEESAWFGKSVPKGTPSPIVDKLNREVNAALADAGMKEKMAELGGDPARLCKCVPLCWCGC